MNSLFLLLLVLMPLLQSAAQRCDTPYTQRNFKLQGHVNETLPLSSADQCIEKCSSNMVCNSINFHPDQDLCELNNANHLSNPESLVYSPGSHFVNYLKRPPDKCSDKLCSEPLVCIIKNISQDFECLSPPPRIMVNDLCEVPGNENVLLFPRRSLEDKVVFVEPFVSMTAFTISLWVQIDDKFTVHSPLSYATTTNDNELAVFFANTYTELTVNGTFLQISKNFIDGVWHHFCATWENTAGKWVMYIDGTKEGEGNAHIGHVIPKGALILGQEQDSYMGGFDVSQTYQGNLTSVNIWDRVLATNEISDLSIKCPTGEGNAVKWSDLKTKTFGNVKLICKSFCS